MVPDPWWAVPGGRLRSSETASEALARELREETDLNCEPGPLRAVIETRFEHRGVLYEEVGLYFSVDGEFPGKTFTREDEEATLEFAWFHVDDLEKIDIRPRAIVEVLRASDGEIRHLVQRG